MKWYQESNDSRRRFPWIEPYMPGHAKYNQDGTDKFNRQLIDDVDPEGHAFVALSPPVEKMSEGHRLHNIRSGHRYFVLCIEAPNDTAKFIDALRNPLDKSLPFTDGVPPEMIHILLEHDKARDPARYRVLSEKLRDRLMQAEKDRVKAEIEQEKNALRDRLDIIVKQQKSVVVHDREEAKEAKGAHVEDRVPTGSPLTPVPPPPKASK